MMESSYFLLDDKIQNGIKDVLKWNSLTPIQEKTIPRLLNGDNSILIAQTAGGKTEAAFLPIISEIYKEKLKPISVIYVSPIRALLNNQEFRLKKLGKIGNIDAFKWHGEVDYSNKRKFKIEPKHIIATTPESLEVILMSDSYDPEELFSNIRFIVIDEVHYFAENYRGAQLLSIIERIQTYSKYDIQRIGLSATVGNPEEILDWISGSSKRGKSVIKPENKGNKSKIFIRYFDEFSENTVSCLLPELRDKKALFFCNSRTNSEMMSRILKNLGLNAKVHHSSISKNLREMSEDKLKNAPSEMCLCCTSTMELGIDVGELDVVMQLNSPSTVASFRQRMGRTGRRQGTISHYEFCVSQEFFLINAIAIVELARQKWIESTPTPLAAYTVLFQQLFSMIQQKFGLKHPYLKGIVEKSNSFKDINEDKLLEFIQYLIDENYLEFSNGEYLLGKEIEKEYGYNFIMNFLSVFETIPEFSIIYKNKEIGTLQSWFIYSLLKENKTSKFILAGNTWVIDKIDYDRYRIYVQISKEGGLAIWMGNGMVISYEIAKQMLKVLNSNNDYPYIDIRSKDVLKSIRLEHSALSIDLDEILIDVVKDGFDIYTYAGHKVNFTLGLIIQHELGLEFNVSYDKLKVRKVEKNITEKHILDIFNRLKTDTDKMEEIIEKALISSNFESHSKFYKHLPRFAQIEVLKYELVDIKNTVKLLKESNINIENIYDRL
ncbi:DEAD/DEAH box helicase [Schnuerera ultunensis]|uniref:Lhr-like protein helicase n=1 Tax=[Clostridium] ultunense Esp TaxID=1288971 RepID=A0A1M4PPI8_9FIRM|nr:DEAD/DEAH box helicase [Schnuerera ultunensis]SHD77390.1 Lhr-like protein helicase [[Clostridium] ultunense Esp]